MAVQADEGTVPPEVMSQFPELGELKDRHGNTFYFGNAGDYWHPPFPLGKHMDFRTHARNIRDMEIREDDVLICSFPKSGLHWNNEIVAMLRRQDAKLGKDQEVFIGGFMDIFPTEQIDKLPSPRVLLTHVPFKYVPRQALEKKIKILRLERNPKDVLVSFYNHLHSHRHPVNYPGTFEHFVDLYLEVGYLYGDIFDYLKEFEAGVDSLPKGTVFTSVYEDLKEDTVAQVLKLNEYLETGCSQELCESIAAATSFNTMKKFKDDNISPLELAIFRKNAVGFYRKGEVGDWKNWFTVAMNEKFDKRLEQRLAGYKLQYRYTL